MSNQTQKRKNSQTECPYCLSDNPKHLPYDLECYARKIDTMAMNWRKCEVEKIALEKENIELRAELTQLKNNIKNIKIVGVDHSIWFDSFKLYKEGDKND
jgi:hypothetical protein